MVCVCVCYRNKRKLISCPSLVAAFLSSSTSHCSGTSKSAPCDHPVDRPACDARSGGPTPRFLTTAADDDGAGAAYRVGIGRVNIARARPHSPPPLHHRRQKTALTDRERQTTNRVARNKASSPSLYRIINTLEYRKF